MTNSRKLMGEAILPAQGLGDALRAARRKSVTFDRQKAFDTAYAALVKQGRKAMDAEETGCVYRGPDGLKCAVGWLIPDAKYRKRWDKGFAVTPDSNNRSGGEIRNALGVRGPDSEDAKFLSDLQSVHDNAADGCDFVGDFRKRAKVFAEKWGLDASALAAGTRRAETRSKARAEGCQSGGEAVTPKPEVEGQHP